MTSQLQLPVAPDGAHAGDLVGYDRWGRPMYLPGGGARDGAIVAGPDDDDVDGDPDDEPDDDEPDDAPPAKPARKGNKPSYQELLEQNAALSAQIDPETRRRMNAENRRLRGVRQFVERHNIGDFDAWLTGLGVDPETGKSKAAAPAKPTKATAPAVDAPDVDPGEELDGDEPDGQSDPDLDRRVELEVEKRLAEIAEQNDDRSGLLLQVIQVTSVEAELVKAGFTGTLPKALRVLDLDAIEVDEDGTVSGVEEAVASLKEEIPEWFRTRASGARVGQPRETGGTDVDGGGKPPRKQAEKDWAARAIDGILGRTT